MKYTYEILQYRPEDLFLQVRYLREGYPPVTRNLAAPPPSELHDRIKGAVPLSVWAAQDQAAGYDLSAVDMDPKEASWEPPPAPPPPTPEQVEAMRREQRRIEKRERSVDALEVVARVSVQPVLDSLGDEDLSRVSALFPDWGPDGKLYSAGEILNFDDVLYRVEQEHNSQPDWLPSDEPALYTPYRNPADGPQPWVEPADATLVYAKDDLVTHDNPNDGGNIWIYESAIDANDTEPGRDGTFDRWWTPVEPT